jgi:hypothetical protein
MRFDCIPFVALKAPNYFAHSQNLLCRGMKWMTPYDYALLAEN